MVFETIYPDHSAFPSGEEQTTGLTKRQYIATAIFSAILAAPNEFSVGGVKVKELDPPTMAKLAVMYADDLIKALNEDIEP